MFCFIGTAMQPVRSHAPFNAKKKLPENQINNTRSTPNRIFFHR